MTVLDWVKSLDPYLGGLLVLGVIWLIVGVLTRSFRIWRVARGTDGKFSTSILQQFVWTAAVVYSYSAVFVARAHVDRLEPISEIPPNVLLALGFSVGTAVLARGITTDHIESGKEVKASIGGLGQGASSIVEDDAGRLDLAKLQLLAWTLIAVAAYVLATIAAVGATLAVEAASDLPALPDIDPTLMVLTGIGQGAYLGRKLVTSTSVGITSLDKTSATPGESVAAYGVGFGISQDSSVLTMKDQPIQPDTWSPTKITFTVPPTPPWGGAWTKQKIRINVVVAGSTGANAVFLEVTPPAA